MNNCLLKVAPPNSTSLGVRSSTNEFGVRAETNTQTIVQAQCGNKHFGFMILKERLSGSFDNFAKESDHSWNGIIGSCIVTLATSRWKKCRKGTKDTKNELFHFTIFQRIKELSSPLATPPSYLEFYVKPHKLMEL